MKVLVGFSIKIRFLIEWLAAYLHNLLKIPFPLNFQVQIRLSYELQKMHRLSISF